MGEIRESKQDRAPHFTLMCLCSFNSPWFLFWSCSWQQEKKPVINYIHKESWVSSRGFQQKGNCFSHAGKKFWTGLLSKKNFPLNGQTRQAKSLSQLVSLPSAWPLLKPLKIWLTNQLFWFLAPYSNADFLSHSIIIIKKDLSCSILTGHFISTNMQTRFLQANFILIGK